MERKPLFTERRSGEPIRLSDDGYAALLVQAFDSAEDAGLFSGFLPKKLSVRRMLLGDEAFKAATHLFASELGDPWPGHAMWNSDLLKFHLGGDELDLLEVLHRVVTAPTDGGPSQSAGQHAFRELMNPILARRSPPMRLTSRGQVAERPPEEMRRLVDAPLPVGTPASEVGDRIEDAVAHYYRRGSSHGDQRAAVAELANALEYMRDDARKYLGSKDENDLFEIVNRFTVRHNKMTTKRDWDEAVFLPWMFYVFLASIRAVLALRDRATNG